MKNRRKQTLVSTKKYFDNRSTKGIDTTTSDEKRERRKELYESVLDKRREKDDYRELTVAEQAAFIIGCFVLVFFVAVIGAWNLDI